MGHGLSVEARRTMKTTQVAVLIPYFQRQPGILQATVRSVLAQQGCDDYAIIIVDDGAPVSAVSEMATLTPRERAKVHIIEQANAGPSAARNRALAEVPADTTYIALLDSDDALEPCYLATAVAALERGYDLFFGNSVRCGVEGTRFEWHTATGATLDPAAHRLLDETVPLYEFQGDFFDFIVHRSNIIGPSSLMYRHTVGVGVRYHERIRIGEDRIFKLQLCRRVEKVVFSPRICAREGRGVNIFDSAQWGSEQALALLADYLAMNHFILREIPLNPAQRAHVRAHLNSTRYSFVASLLHHLHQGIRIDWPLVGRTLVSDPGMLPRLVPNLLQVIATKLRHRSPTE